MKKKFFLVAVPLFMMACNNTTKDSVEKADSANKAIQDSSLNHRAMVVDEESTSFLTQAANGGMAEVQIAEIAQQKAVTPRVKEFGAMMMRDHSAANEQVKALAAQRNIVLPQSITADKQDEIDKLSKEKGIDFDKAFMKAMVKGHEETIDLFTKALTSAKDPDINSFADKTLMTLRVHLDSAKTIQRSLK